MPTDKQIEANRANAQKSTGPKTPEGKSRSSANSRKHGFTASTFAVVRFEQLDEVARLRRDLIDVYQPANAQELYAIERIALCQHALLRASRLENGLFTCCINLGFDPLLEPISPLLPEVVGDIEVTRLQNRNYGLADGFTKMNRISNSWSLYLRYHAQVERQYRRAIEEFERLRKLRPELPNEPNFAAQADENPDPPPSETNPIPGSPAQQAGSPKPVVNPPSGRAPIHTVPYNTSECVPAVLDKIVGDGQRNSGRGG